MSTNRTRAHKAQSRNPAPKAALSTELDAIQDALLDLVSHFRLVDQRLYGDLASVPEEYQPAATVLHGATEALDSLHTRLDELSVRMADLFREPGWREAVQAEAAGERVQ